MYLTVSISKGLEIILPWRMFEVQLDWTFAKLLEASLLSVTQPERLLDMHGEPVCELRKEMNAPPAESVQVPLGFNVDQCCKVNGSFVRYLYYSTSLPQNA